VLFGLSLAFSLLIYALIAVGIGEFVAQMRASSQYAADWGAEFEAAAEGLSEAPAPEEELIEDEFAEEEYEGSFDEDYYAGFDEMDYGENPLTGLAFLFMGAGGAVFLFYFILIVVFVVGAHILAVGHLMGNGVRVSEKQFPELWAEFARAAAELGVRRLPAFYLVESGGLLNAFATRLFTRSYVAIYADLAERLYAGDAGSVSFVIAHELVHVKRNHSLKSLFTLPAEMLPFLKSAWRRACEYGCDAGGQELAPDGAEKGLILLAAGPRLAPRVDADAYLESFKAERSIWKRAAELFASHPHLPKRIAALRKRAETMR
jgi:Zn-dependent protease with chaperone function